MLTLGDNTNAPIKVLTRQVLLCCGEDPDELVQVMSHDVGCRLVNLHSYRCYRFWRCTQAVDNSHEITLVWSGIGTGCVEPLLYEMLSDKTLISELILIGTAGKIGSTSETHSPTAHSITAAYMGPTALSALSDCTTLRPTLDVRAKPATIFSTDLYYMWNSSTIDQWPRSLKYRDAWRDSTLVDMEVAQVYWLCSHLGSGAVRYAAIKGAANMVGDVGVQVGNSRSVLASCAQVALETFQAVANSGLR